HSANGTGSSTSSGPTSSGTTGSGTSGSESTTGSGSGTTGSDSASGGPASSTTTTGSATTSTGTGTASTGTGTARTGRTAAATGSTGGPGSTGSACAISADSVRITEIDVGTATVYSEDEARLMPFAISPVPSGGSRLAFMGSDGMVHVVSLDANDAVTGTA